MRTLLAVAAADLAKATSQRDQRPYNISSRIGSCGIVSRSASGITTLATAFGTMSDDGRSQSHTTNPMPRAPVNISEASESDNYRESFIDIAALTIVFILVGTFMAILVYAWRKRCDGRRNACAGCHKRQHSNMSCRDDDLEDVDLVFDGKDVVGKQD